jgi:hypothetical protein
VTFAGTEGHGANDGSMPEGTLNTSHPRTRQKHNNDKDWPAMCQCLEQVRPVWDAEEARRRPSSRDGFPRNIFMEEAHDVSRG